jgi:hypothetical protein
VTGGHTYTDEGNFVVSATIVRTADNTQIIPSGTVGVPESDVLAPQSAIIASPTQTLNNGVVGRFSDGNLANTPSDFTALINWGDGSPLSAGTITGSNGSFAVSGSHVFAFAGTPTVTAMLSDDAPGTAQATATSIATIGVAGQIALNSATEGTALPTNTTVATFTDGNLTDTASAFTAAINWGDGSITAGTISGSSGAFSVIGGHTYTDEGNFVVSATIERTADNTQIMPSGTVGVPENDLLTPHGVMINGIVNQPLNDIVLATFDDSDIANTVGDFTALINWGDGSPLSAGTITGSNGSFEVSGSHTYTSDGVLTATVKLLDDAPGTANALAITSIDVSTATTVAEPSSGGILALGTALLLLRSAISRRQAS